jgi:hypothetical protein
MKRTIHFFAKTCACVACALGGLAWASLPPPSPAQAQAAANKKAQADAQAAKDKQELVATMDAITARWRARAASQGLHTNPPVAVAAPAAAVSAPKPGPVAAANKPAAAQPPPAAADKGGTAPPAIGVKKKP